MLLQHEHAAAPLARCTWVQGAAHSDSFLCSVMPDLCRNCMPRRDKPNEYHCWGIKQPILYRVVSHGMVRQRQR